MRIKGGGGKHRQSEAVESLDDEEILFDPATSNARTVTNGKTRASEM